ncbi:MAG: 3-oxoacyl-ACP synthase [Candidatus Entotheonella factor]|uniref:3-oxoacyl-[acyl-carrier-protein] synthase 2 n=1 Tax=Entotheonella factor TaxID=1429438 RepID=W4LYS4_ENTF1|nr:MAG: 3-oxoacyl-ACP synthase [Candidatus Entotheonella factor]
MTPLGTGTQKTWEALLKGVSGIGPIDRFDASGYDCRIGAFVRDFDPHDFMGRKDAKRMARFSQFAVAGAAMAIEDAGLSLTPELAERTGCLLGVGIGGLSTLEQNHEKLMRSGPDRVAPMMWPMVIPNIAPGQVCLRFGLHGPNSVVSTACAAGTHAIGDAYRLIQRGDADVMLTGGCEAALTPLCLAAFANMRALSSRNDEPQRASRPFDAERDGFVMGEGGGVLVLEELEQARQRGASIYAEVIGYGMSADAYHLTQPDPEARGVVLCMQRTLQDAGIAPQDMDYINAHGTSTPYNDRCETLAIRDVFGDHAYRLAVSSTKSMTGHLFGGGGGIEAVFTVLSIAENVIPPTINLETPDPECDLDYVPHEARYQPVRVAMSNSFAFGGTNASLIFAQYQESP